MAAPVYPYFPFTVIAWRQIVTDIDNDHAAALHFLVGHYCITGGKLPFLDDRAMAHICRVSLKRWLRMRTKLAVKFPRNGWSWPEIDAKIARWQKTSVQRSIAAKSGKMKNPLPMRQGVFKPTH